MVRGGFEAEGFAYYVAELRKGATDPYFAYRVYEKCWNVPPNESGLVRRATIRLIESDPWFLATAMPHFLHSLKTEDLERLTEFVGAGPARKAAPMLRAMLWYHGRKGPFHPDKVGRAQLRKALSFLQRVPTKQRDQSWHGKGLRPPRAQAIWDDAEHCHIIDDKGEMRESTPKECKGLEPAAVWEPNHIADRLKDTFAGRPNRWLLEALRRSPLHAGIDIGLAVDLLGFRVRHVRSNAT